MEHVIIRVLQGRATLAQKEELRAWRLAAPANEERYCELARIWELSGRAEPKTTARPAPVAHELIRRADARPTDPMPLRHRAWGNRFSSWATRGIAAAALLALGFAIGGLRSPEGAGSPFGAAEIMTGESEFATVLLGDGSIVRLAPESRLRVTGKANDREVWLDGRAFFAVAGDGDRPFRVRSRAGDALVLGTRFEIRVREDDLRVAVVEGSVAVSVGEEKVQVGAGEVSHAIGGAPPTVEDVGDVRPLLGWMGQFLVFQATPLGQVARELEQQYGIRVRIVDERVAQRTVTAWFTNESAGDVLMMICRVADVHCSMTNGVATIEP